ncbi:hypothetical protein B0J12DRAFT_565000 [Macrophomina phaseolina]|uniref:Gag1-like clamp domain-containing protein n=1 Tax=Macrophomina phaseolina TaxID=35725 RepID=A0ABQ8GP76_9PEZI|nr:hypothetical protein B0J12DRAFT_565000 [Macrophomina phaseolina]
MDTNQSAARDARRFLTDRVRNDWTFPSIADVHANAAGSGPDATYYDSSNEAGGGSKREYKFDSPEHVGRSLEERAQRRKRRRRARLEEEMAWNEGVRCFVRRRDAWTGAASVRKYARRRSRASAEMDPLVPLAPPLLPHNAIRQSITPKAYPDIYGKIVVAGQTPKVPINLAHMTRALVQGWKDDGEWPPRPGPADPLMGRKKVALAGGRVGTGHHGEFLAHHPHLQKGVESVKKVFRLSGGHHGHSNPSGGIVHDGQPPAS